MSETEVQFEDSLALSFFGIGMKTDLFQSRATAEFFSNFLAYQMQHFRSIIF